MLPAFDIKSLSAGVLLTAIAGIIGLWIRKTTTIDVSNIDDRGKFRQDLMKYKEMQDIRFAALEKTVRILQDRDSLFIRMFAGLSAEMRLLNGHMGSHMIELALEVLDPQELRQRAQLMSATLGRMQSIIDREERILNISVLEHMADIEQDKKTVGATDAKAQITKKTDYDNILGPDGTK